MLNDPLANVFSKIMNAERRGMKECMIKPSSKIIKKLLNLMNAQGYIGKYEEIHDNRGNILKINLIGRINECNIIKPHYQVKKTEFEKFEKRYLPAKDFGIIFISTSFGIMTHIEAKEKNTGGILLAYCY